jgi:hypothetical protein
VTERTALSNQLRALLLERGITVPQGRRKLERLLPEILADEDNGLGWSICVRSGVVSTSGSRHSMTSLPSGHVPMTLPAPAGHGPGDRSPHRHGSCGGGRQRPHIRAWP